MQASCRYLSVIKPYPARQHFLISLPVHLIRLYIIDTDLLSRILLRLHIDVQPCAVQIGVSSVIYFLGSHRQPFKFPAKDNFQQALYKTLPYLRIRHHRSEQEVVKQVHFLQFLFRTCCSQFFYNLLIRRFFLCFFLSLILFSHIILLSKFNGKKSIYDKHKYKLPITVSPRSVILIL